MNENVFLSKNGHKVKYKYQKAKSDRRHLVVVFAGFGVDYAFQNVGKSFKCDVLWLKDDHEGVWCYYLGKKGSFSFSESVDELIQYLLSQKKLTRDQCTLIGGSKGGFASLYIGLRYNYKNIISSAFTSLIGNRMTTLWPKIARFVMKDPSSDSDIHAYNSLLENLLLKDQFLDKNIYVFLSKDDEYYIEHQEYLLEHFTKYSNFNLVETNSSLVFNHPRVTEYNVPLMISFVNSLIEGVVPRFGKLCNGSLCQDIQEEEGGNILPQASLSKYLFDKGLLFIEGTAFLKNRSYPNQKKYKKKLVLKNIDGNSAVILPLGNTSNRIFSVRFYEDSFCDYRSAGFATINRKGLDLSDVPNGVYDLDISLENVEANQILVQSPLFSDKKIDIKYQQDGIEYRLWTYKNIVRLTKRSICDITIYEDIFKVEKICFLAPDILHVEGVYIIPGFEAIDYKDVIYYLIIKYKGNLIRVFDLANSHKTLLNEQFDNGYGIYQKAYFSTLNREGILLDVLSDGIYDLSVVLSYKGTLYSKDIDQKINVLNAKKSIE